MVQNPALTSTFIKGNYIGTSAAGTSAIPNGASYGLWVTMGSGVQIGGTNAGEGNIIAGNTSGISLSGYNHVVQGNSIGIGVGGVIIPNTGDGIDVSCENGLIGGTSVGAANVIGGNRFQGIQFSFASGCTVQGNYIGIDISGARKPNGLEGIDSWNSTGNLIGGVVAGARNMISGNGHCGIYLEQGSSSNRIQGNLIGVNPAGSGAVSNALHGIMVDSATNNLIGGPSFLAGNVISGNAGNGILLRSGATSNSIQGNFIGVAANGMTAIANGINGVMAGVEVTASGNLIGGTSNGAGNVISGNAGDGILVFDATNTIIQGNSIGLSAYGSIVVPNGTYAGATAGIHLDSGAFGTVIGGTVAGAGNVISGNPYYQINLWGSLNTTIQGNIIGLDKVGVVAFTNAPYAISGTEASWTQIGGSVPGAGNVLFSTQATVGFGGTNCHHNTVQGNMINLQADGSIASTNIYTAVAFSTSSSNVIGGAGSAGNVIFFGNGEGIKLSGSNCMANVVQGNYMGVGPDGKTPRRYVTGGGGVGINILNSYRNMIGGTNAGEGNIIANVGFGVAVIGTNAVGNAILGNSIYSNTFNSAPAPGIALGPVTGGGVGVVTNDAAGDLDLGGNNFQNYPVITNVVSESGSTRVQGYLISAASKTYRLEFFCNDRSNAEGRVFLGAGTTNTGSGGTGAFAFVLAGYASTGTWVTATATDSSNNTSEFSFPSYRPTQAPDTDGDGMPDYWESLNGFNPSSSADAALDTDGDGMSNLREYLAGTDPRVKASCLRITNFFARATYSVSFPTSLYRSYDLQFASNLAPTTVWTTVVPGALGNGLGLTLSNNLPAGAGFYKVNVSMP